MLSAADNETITRTGPGTPVGELFRRFWLPALVPSEVPHPDSDPIRVRLLGEDLVSPSLGSALCDLGRRALRRERSGFAWHP